MLIFMMLLTCFSPVASAAEVVTYREYLEAQIPIYASYIRELTLADGSIAQYRPAKSTYDTSMLPTVNGITPQEYTKWKSAVIVPYFSEAAVLGLLKADPENSRDIIEGFIKWYFDNINTAASDRSGVDGTMYDYVSFINPDDNTDIISIPKYIIEAYRYSDQTENPYGYDSTDSYAACFFRILELYYRTYGDAALFIDKLPEIERIKNAMLSTYCQSIGLTGAKPTYMICYLMDNCEVYDGTLALAELYGEVFKDDAKKSTASDLGERVKRGIETYLFDSSSGTYYPYCHPNGRNDGRMSWETFYADATCQLFTVRFDIVSPESENAQRLYAAFNSYYGNEKGENWKTLSLNSVFPWSVLSTIAVKMGDYEASIKFIETIYRKYGRSQFPYPMYNGEAGHILYSIALMLEANPPLLDTYNGEAEESKAESSAPVSKEESVLTESDTPDENNIAKALYIGGGIILLGLAAALIIIFSNKKTDKQK